MNDIIVKAIMQKDKSLTILNRTLKIVACISQSNVQDSKVVNSTLADLLYFYKINQSDFKITKAFDSLRPIFKEIQITQSNIELLFDALKHSSVNDESLYKLIFGLTHNEKVLSVILQKMNINKYDNIYGYGNIDNVAKYFNTLGIDKNVIFQILNIINKDNYESEDIKNLLQTLVNKYPKYIEEYKVKYNSKIEFPSEKLQQKELDKLLEKTFTRKDFTYLLELLQNNKLKEISSDMYNNENKVISKLIETLQKNEDFLTDLLNLLEKYVTNKTDVSLIQKNIQIILSNKLLINEYVLGKVFDLFNYTFPEQFEGEYDRTINSELRKSILENLLIIDTIDKPYTEKLFEIVYSEEYRSDVRYASLVLLAVKSQELNSTNAIKRLYDYFIDVNTDLNFKIKIFQPLLYIDSTNNLNFEPLKYENLMIMFSKTENEELKEELIFRLTRHYSEDENAVSEIFKILLSPQNPFNIRNKVLDALYACEIISNEQIDTLINIVKNENEEQYIRHYIVLFLFGRNLLSKTKAFETLKFVLNSVIPWKKNIFELWYRNTEPNIDQLVDLYKTSNSSDLDCELKIYSLFLEEDMSLLDFDTIKTIMNVAHRIDGCLADKGKILANIPRYDDEYIALIIELVENSFHSDGGLLDDQGKIGKFVEELLKYFSKCPRIPQKYFTNLISYIEHDSIGVWAGKELAQNLYKIDNISLEMIKRIILLFRNSKLHPTPKEGLMESIVNICTNNMQVFILFYFEYYMKIFTKLNVHTVFYNKYRLDDSRFKYGDTDYIEFFIILASKIDIEILFKIYQENNIDVGEFIFFNSITNHTTIIKEDNRLLFYNKENKLIDSGLDQEHFKVLMQTLNSIKDNKSLNINQNSIFDQEIGNKVIEELKFICEDGIDYMQCDTCNENCWEIMEVLAYSGRRRFKCKKCGHTETD